MASCAEEREPLLPREGAEEPGTSTTCWGRVRGDGRACLLPLRRHLRDDDGAFAESLGGQNLPGAAGLRRGDLRQPAAGEGPGEAGRRPAGVCEDVPLLPGPAVRAGRLRQPAAGGVGRRARPPLPRASPRRRLAAHGPRYHGQLLLVVPVPGPPPAGRAPRWLHRLHDGRVLGLLRLRGRRGEQEGTQEGWP